METQYIMVVDLLSSFSAETIITLGLLSIMGMFLVTVTINELLQKVVPRITHHVSEMIQEREKQKTIRKAMQIHRDSEALSIAEDEFYAKTKELVDTDAEETSEEEIQEKLTALSEDVEETMKSRDTETQ